MKNTLSRMLFYSWLILFSQLALANQSLDKIVAVVNDAVVTQSELNNAMVNVKQQMANNPAGMPGEEVLHKQVLDQVINRKLQLQLAEQAGIQVTDADVTKAINTIASENKITVAELYEKLPTQGLNVKKYHKEIHDEIAIQQLQQQEISAHINISPQEVDDFLRSKAWKEFHSKEYHLEDILITLPDVPNTQNIIEAKSHADAIMNKLHQGMSFQQIAMSDSSSSNALQGGDLGWRKLPEIPAEFSQQLVHAKPNDIIGPLLTPNGFHIIKLAGIREAVSTNNKDMQSNDVRQLIFQRKFSEGLQSWLTKIRSAAFINTHLEA